MDILHVMRKSISIYSAYKFSEQDKDAALLKEISLALPGSSLMLSVVINYNR